MEIARRQIQPNNRHCPIEENMPRSWSEVHSLGRGRGDLRFVWTQWNIPRVRNFCPHQTQFFSTVLNPELNFSNLFLISFVFLKKIF